MNKDIEAKEIAPEPKRRIENVSEYLFHYMIFVGKKRETCTDFAYELHGLPDLPYYSKSMHRIVMHYSKAFHDLFQAALELHLEHPVRNEWDYASYAVSTCKRFMDQDFGFLQEELKELKMPFFFLLMSATILYQLEEFSKSHGHITCFGCESKCLVVVYDRYLKSRFKEAGGFDGFKDYCDSVWQMYESLPNVLACRVMGLPGFGKTMSELRDKIQSSVIGFSDTNDLTESERRYFGSMIRLL